MVNKERKKEFPSVQINCEEWANAKHPEDVEK